MEGNLESILKTNNQMVFGYPSPYKFKIAVDFLRLIISPAISEVQFL
jgi:hypothetical protein